MPFRIMLLCAVTLRLSAAAPPRIDYVTYLGGSHSERVVGIAVNAAGSAYVAGNTFSPDFPLTSTNLGAPSAGASCAYVTKFNPSGTAIDFSVCLAASQAIAFALDANGNMYLTVTKPDDDSSMAVVKLDPTAQNIVYSTAIGGDTASIAVNPSGEVYVSGSAGPGLATTSGAYQQQYPGGQCFTRVGSPQGCANAFITKLAASGAVAWTTYLGGSGPDGANAIGVDGTGNVWVAGQTVSPDFPTTAGAISRTFHGEVDLGPERYGDAFVSKLDATGSHLLYSTYLGGSGPDAAFSIAIDATGAAYVAGGTQSSNFPTTPGAFTTTYSSPIQLPCLCGNGFVTKFDSSGSLVYSTYTGPGSSASSGLVDSAGQVYVNVGVNVSSTPMLPTCAKPPHTEIIILNSTGSAIVGTSPIPGAYLALDGRGGLYSAGEATTLVFFSTPQAFQTQYGGGDSDAFAAKVDFSHPAAASLSSVLNAASMLPGYATPFPTGAVAPGEIVTLLGDGFGSSTPSVNFGALPATILYASNCKINAVVPFGFVPGLATVVTIQANGQTLGPVELPVVMAAPGIFTADGSGSGQAAVLNQDGTVNSPSNPAARDSFVSMYITGAGSLKPPIPDGATGPMVAPFPVPTAGVSARIGYIDATIAFFGQAPGLIAGITQVNIQIPQSAPVGAEVQVLIYAGDYESQYVQPATLAVK